MASLFIAEFSMFGTIKAPTASGWGDSAPIPAVPPVAEQKITIGVTTQSAAFNAATKMVRLHAEAACCVEFGADPIATTDNMRLAAGQTEYFGVSPGQKLAVITFT